MRQLLPQFKIDMQVNNDARDGTHLHYIDKVRSNYVRAVIREYAEFKNDYFSLFASDLPIHEKKIFMTYILDPVIYQDLTCEEYVPEMQQAIDAEIDDYYHDYMREKGFDL
jgi:hypothetical protein